MGFKRGEPKFRSAPLGRFINPNRAFYASLAICLVAYLLNGRYDEPPPPHGKARRNLEISRNRKKKRKLRSCVKHCSRTTQNYNALRSAILLVEPRDNLAKIHGITMGFAKKKNGASRA